MGSLSRLLLLHFLAVVLPSVIGQFVFDCSTAGTSFAGDAVGVVLQASLDAASQAGGSQSVANILCNNLALQGLFPSTLNGNSFAVGFSQLTSLALANDGLSGPIPVEIGNFQALQILDLSSNMFSEALPTQLGQLSNLAVLNLGFNGFSGAVPTQLGTLPLTIIDIQSNDFNSMPDAAFPSSLIIFNGASNQLSGTIPSILGQTTLPSLTEVQLAENSFTSISPELLTLPELLLLDLRENDLQGGFPPTAAITGLQKLTKLDLSNNNIGGSISGDAFLILTSLKVLNIQNNMLTGTFPTEIANLKSLTTLLVGGNSFTGVMPPHSASVTDTPVGTIFETSAPTTANSENNASPGKIIGILIGVLFGLALIILIVVRRRQKSNGQNASIDFDRVVAVNLENTLKQKDFRDEEFKQLNPPSLRFTMQGPRDTMRTAAVSLGFSTATGPSRLTSNTGYTNYGYGQAPPALPPRGSTANTSTGYPYTRATFDTSSFQNEENDLRNRDLEF